MIQYLAPGCSIIKAVRNGDVPYRERRCESMGMPSLLGMHILTGNAYPLRNAHNLYRVVWPGCSGTKALFKH